MRIHNSVDASDIFLFFLLGGEGGAPEAPRRGGGGRFFIENPRRGGGGPGCQEGGGGGRVFCRELGGWGLNFFFFGAERPTKINMKNCDRHRSELDTHTSPISQESIL